MKNIRNKVLKPGEIIPLNFDFVFTSIFANPGNMIIIENFLSCLLDIDIKELRGNITIQNRNLILENKNSKNKQIDLLFDYNGEKINIELNNRYSKGIKERNIVYLSNIHGRQLKYQDNTYQRIEKTIQINLNKKHTNKKLKQVYYLKNEEGEILSTKFEIIEIDMELAKEICYNNFENKLARWCMLLISNTKEEFKRYLGDDLMEKEAKELLEEEQNKYTTDEDVVALYSAYTKDELERNTILEEEKEEAQKIGFEQGMKEGIKEGIKEGVLKRNIEIATEMKIKGISIKDISDITGLTEEEITNL